MLPAWRCGQMMKIKHLRGRVQCAVAWLLARELGAGDEWTYNEHGKPYSTGREKVYFSVSHCGGAVAAVAADQEVGIDIEETGRYKANLERMVLNEEEQELLDSLSGDKRAEEFIGLWTRKEAVFKCLGTGITHEIKDILRRRDVSVFTLKIGGRMLSVATRDEIVGNP